MHGTLKARKNKIVFNTIQEYHCYKVYLYLKVANTLIES